MKLWQFEAAFTGKEWLTPAFALVDNHGKLQSLTKKKPDNPAIKKHEKVSGWLIPGWQNAHSHSFQYAMAGLTEHMPAGAGTDDFWSWREAMYESALQMTPEKLQVIAKRAYLAMQRCGITSVSEFHYLHHDPAGKPYANVAEMGERLMIAAQEVGMQLCLVPVFYQNSGFGKPASERQRRFVFSELDDYWAFLEATRQVSKKYSGVTLGAGVHSLRAASPDDAKAILNAKAEFGPLHIHIAEQQKEVDECMKALKQRPVEWLLNHVELNERHNLVHATHMTESETDGLAASGATAVLCPSTEGNLGDGFFPLGRYMQQKGRWALGSDSHISVNLAEDLRWLDYGQRLLQRKRNVLCRKPGDDSAVIGITESWQRGRLAAGRTAADFFPVGEHFTGVVLDPNHDCFNEKAPERRLSAYVYASDPSVHLRVIT